MDKTKLSYIAIVVLLIAIIAIPMVMAKPGGRAPKVKPQCNDKIDNDGDTFTDYPDDPGCTGRQDQSELGTTQCDNGIDDDEDTYIDYPDDPDCDSPTDDLEQGEDVTPPGPVTNLDETSTGLTWIYWEWTNPGDSDFDHVEVWVDNEFQVNTSNEYYNATGLSEGTPYEIEVRPVDTSDNIGEWTNDTASTQSDQTPPGPITGLGETSTGTTWIYWEWTNPGDLDLNHIEVWLDNQFKVNTTNAYYNATGLDPETSYEIEVRPVDDNDNIGVWTNDSATTDAEPDVTPPVITIVTPSDYNKTVQRNWYYVNVTLNEAGNNANLEEDSVNYSMSQGTTNTEWYINRTGLSDGNVTWRVYADDTAQNTGKTGDSWIEIDAITPPGPITGLGETSTGTSWIYWEWTNPGDADFDHTEVWLDTVFKVNTSNEYYNATGLDPETSYEIEVRPVDDNDNIGVWTNDSATTDAEPGDTEEPVVSAIWPTMMPANVTVPFYINASDNVAINNCRFQWNWEPYVEMSLWYDHGTYETWVVNYTTPGPGDYMANASCYDTSNNLGYGPLTNITIV